MKTFFLHLFNRLLGRKAQSNCEEASNCKEAEISTPKETRQAQHPKEISEELLYMFGARPDLYRENGTERIPKKQVRSKGRKR